MTRGQDTIRVTPASDHDALLLAALRRGEEAAFVALLDQHHSALMRLAMIYVRDRAVAEEVVQETWEGVLKGLARFEARSSLQTWIFHILVNRARTRGVREGRSIPFSAVWDPDTDPDEPAVAPERFQMTGEPGHWVSMPQNWSDLPEARLLGAETRAHVQAAIAALPPQQAEVITLRDVEGWTADEACAALAITETNQRVLLHRARSRVRQALESYLQHE